MDDNNCVTTDTNNYLSSGIENIQDKIDKNKDETIEWVSSLSLKIVEQDKRITELTKELHNQYVKKPDNIGCCIYFLGYTIYIPVKLNWLQRFIVKHLFKAVHVTNEL